MSGHRITTYVAVTPARNEAENLRRLGSALAAQTVRPQQWVIVENGSSDETPAVAADFAAAHDWVTVIKVAGTAHAAPGAPVVRAFAAGLAAVREDADVIVKLDADVSFDEDYFECQLAAFSAEPALGIASGECLEEIDGSWRPVRAASTHARGAVRAYRSHCFEDVAPLEEEMGWDGIDELKAALRGWRTGIVPDLAFRHHRAVGARDGGRASRWLEQGRGSYFMGYRLGFLVARSLYRARKDPAALAMIWGYAAAALSRRPRVADAEVRDYLRRQQRLNGFLIRASDARHGVRRASR